MKPIFVITQVLCGLSICYSQPTRSVTKPEAEYYVEAYAHHYGVPSALVRAIIQRESKWQPCTVSSKGAVGLMQLMPRTATRFGVVDRCNVDQNTSGGVRYLAWLMLEFHNDLRLVTAAYYAGEDRISRRRLAYRNPEVVGYVSAIRKAYLHETGVRPAAKNIAQGGKVR